MDLHRAIRLPRVATFLRQKESATWTECNVIADQHRPERTLIVFPRLLDGHRLRLLIEDAQHGEPARRDRTVVRHDATANNGARLRLFRPALTLAIRSSRCAGVRFAQDA